MVRYLRATQAVVVPTSDQRKSSNRWHIAVRSNRATPSYGIVDQKHLNRTSNRNKHAVKVQAGNTFLAEETEQEAPDNRAYNAKPDVEPEPLALPVDYFASDEPCDKSKYDPT
jgi:hypothetical protein